MQAQDLAAEGVEVLRWGDGESVAQVHVQQAIRAEAEVGDLVRRALFLAEHVEHREGWRDGRTATVEAREAHHDRVVRGGRTGWICIEVAREHIARLRI